MTDGLTVAKKAAALWEQVHPGESTYFQCQRISGYYFQWAFQGNENGIKVYPTAKAASEASTMFTSNVNDPSVEAGDEIFYEFGKYGHVVTVVGRSNGRTIALNTARSGEKLVDLGNHMSIDYADSLNLKVIGVSHANGRNLARELTDYVLGGAQPTGTISELADQTMRGDFGDGDVRRQKLGTNYGAVQDEINRRLKKPAPSVNIDVLAREVIAGKHGNGQQRRDILGANYDAVQARVNALLNASSPDVRTYTIQKGDSLSSIAKRLGYKGGWQALYEKNRGVIGGNASVVYAGQVLTL